MDASLWASPESDTLDVSARCQCTVLWGRPKTPAKSAFFWSRNLVTNFFFPALLSGSVCMGAALTGLQPSEGLALLFPLVCNLCTLIAQAMVLPALPLALRLSLSLLTYLVFLVEQNRADYSGRLGGGAAPHMIGILLGGGTDVMRPEIATPFYFEGVTVLAAVVMAVAYRWDSAPPRAKQFAFAYIVLGGAIIPCILISRQWRHRIMMPIALVRMFIGINVRNLHCGGNERKTED